MGEIIKKSDIKELVELYWNWVKKFDTNSYTLKITKAKQILDRNYGELTDIVRCAYTYKPYDMVSTVCDMLKVLGFEIEE